MHSTAQLISLLSILLLCTVLFDYINLKEERPTLSIECMFIHCLSPISLLIDES